MMFKPRELEQTGICASINTGLYEMFKINLFAVENGNKSNMYM